MTEPASAIDRLLALPEPYGPITAEDDALFAAAMAECDAHHRARNPRYAQLWHGDERPLLPVGLFKRADLATPVDDDGAWLGSSMTGMVAATRLFLDDTSSDRLDLAMRRILGHAGFTDERPARFLLLSPDPDAGPHPGYAAAFARLTACAPVRERVFAVDTTGRLLVDVALAALRRWADDPAPVFLFGLTACFEGLAAAAPGSIPQRAAVRALTGGGWQGQSPRLARAELVNRLDVLLHPPALDLRALFGLTEHPLCYPSCARGRFHIPKYARAWIVDETGAFAPPGAPGLLRLACPLFESLPSHDLLTEDRGTWGVDCPCGEPLPYFAYLDRLTAPRMGAAGGAEPTGA